MRAKTRGWSSKDFPCIISFNSNKLRYCYCILLSSPLNNKESDSVSIPSGGDSARQFSSTPAAHLPPPCELHGAGVMAESPWSPTRPAQSLGQWEAAAHCWTAQTGLPAPWESLAGRRKGRVWWALSWFKTKPPVGRVSSGVKDDGPFPASPKAPLLPRPFLAHSACAWSITSHLLELGLCLVRGWGGAQGRDLPAQRLCNQEISVTHGPRDLLAHQARWASSSFHHLAVTREETTQSSHRRLQAWGTGSIRKKSSEDKPVWRKQEFLYTLWEVPHYWYHSTLNHTFLVTWRERKRKIIKMDWPILNLNNTSWYKTLPFMILSFQQE